MNDGVRRRSERLAMNKVLGRVCLGIVLVAGTICVGEEQSTTGGLLIGYPDTVWSEQALSEKFQRSREYAKRSKCCRWRWQNSKACSQSTALLSSSERFRQRRVRRFWSTTCCLAIPSGTSLIPKLARSRFGSCFLSR